MYIYIHMYLFIYDIYILEFIAWSTLLSGTLFLEHD